MSSVCYVRGLSYPVFVMSRGFVCLGFVMTSVCLSWFRYGTILLRPVLLKILIVLLHTKNILSISFNKVLTSILKLSVIVLCLRLGIIIPLSKRCM